VSKPISNTPKLKSKKMKFNTPKKNNASNSKINQDQEKIDKLIKKNQDSIKKLVKKFQRSKKKLDTVNVSLKFYRNNKNVTEKYILEMELICFRRKVVLVNSKPSEIKGLQSYLLIEESKNRNTSRGLSKKISLIKNKNTNEEDN